MIPREEYPRPQFEREEWTNLNGIWEFSFDDADEGIEKKWYEKHNFERNITVPFVYQTEMSGIAETNFHDIVWYKKEFRFIPDKKKIYLLHIGASDYETKVWINGIYIGQHMGGQSPFSFDITHALKKENQISIRVSDESQNLELPRGKQFWKETSEGIFYTRTTGIWQTVWLETLPQNYLKNVRMTPDTDNKCIGMEFLAAKREDADLEIKIFYKDTLMVSDKIGIRKGKAVRSFSLDQNLNLEWEHKSYEWTPETPNLFDVELTLTSKRAEKDKVRTYFAMRKVSVHNGLFLLNNRPYYQKMLLDQGYWRESLMTAPTDEAFIKDIALCREMGFNGVRKHQKAEDPRFLYWADKMGLLVWGEYANAYIYSKDYVKRMVPEWIELIERDYNHPCIIAWVPLNESWGVDGIMHNKEEQGHSLSLYYLTKSLDQTRMVISNDGWLHTKSDLLTVHDYTQNISKLNKRYETTENLLMDMPTNRALFAEGFSYGNQPVILTEFGGISYQTGEQEGWGYDGADSKEEFLEKYKTLMKSIVKAPILQGYVYTQFYDLEQEINGLLTYDREYKIPPEIIREINTIE